MNRRIAAWTIATVAVLGLTACAGAPAAEEENADDASNSAESAPEETNTDQSVEEACGIVLPKVQEATSAVTSIDTSSAASDPQGTVDQFTVLVDGLSDAADSVSNAEVKEATTVVHENFAEFRDVMSKALVDGDTEAASDITTIAGDMTTSFTALTELCS